MSSDNSKSFTSLVGSTSLTSSGTMKSSSGSNFSPEIFSYSSMVTTSTSSSSATSFLAASLSVSYLMM